MRQAVISNRWHAQALAEQEFNSSVGTPAWMAPEVLQGCECYDPMQVRDSCALLPRPSAALHTWVFRTVQVAAMRHKKQDCMNTHREIHERTSSRTLGCGLCSIHECTICLYLRCCCSCIVPLVVRLGEKHSLRLCRQTPGRLGSSSGRSERGRSRTRTW